MQAFSKIRSLEGLRGVFTGWSPTFFGYSVSPARIIYGYLNIH